MRFGKPRNFSLPENLVTPESAFLTRRQLVRRGLALGSTFGLLPAASADSADGQEAIARATRNSELSSDQRWTPEGLAGRYNNFYEFGPDKGIHRRARLLRTDPWTLEIAGLCEAPGKIGMEDILRGFEQEERVYRLRCVETWAMVVPWIGFPLAKLLDVFKPLPDARYVRFETFHRPLQAPYQLVSFWYPWPYTESLRMDEAYNPLTLLATGIYGKPLPKQHGAPIRLIVPWKYGFKSIKSLVKIEFADKRPATFWNQTAPHEYGFLANVDPDVSHPRWSQATERLLGSEEWQRTLKYNGYGEWVASLYSSQNEDPA